MHQSIGFDTASGRATLEAVIALVSLLSATLLARCAAHSRRPRERLLLAVVALLSAIDVVLSAVPAALGSRPIGAATGSSDPVALAYNALAAATLLAAGVGFLVHSARDRTQQALLAGAMLLLAAATLQSLLLRATPPDGVSPAGATRLVAWVLLLAVSLRCHATMRQQTVHAALDAERQRIARDLHDGLAQDLAFIAAYGQRLQADLGPEHPLIVASRRALGASRGTLVDLSASTAQSTVAALRQVAGELATRFDVDVDVRVERDGVGVADLVLDRTGREQIVRIAREAIVNAVRHGAARRVEVSLALHEEELALRISDDGCGISDTGLRKRHGFGLPAMRGRAQALGGELTVRRRSGGGTELLVLVPGRERGTRSRGNRHRVRAAVKQVA
ncbi:MAG: ATP-binding protein [Solirubrobacteraceae bacterium]